MSQLFSAPERGWISRQIPGSTLVKLVDGTVVRVPRQPFLAFGTPVEITISHHGHGDLWGRIVEAFPLPAIPADAHRPLGFIDSSNVANTPDLATGAPHGWPAVWAAAWLLESAGYSVRLVDDPGSDRFWHRDPISSCALVHIKAKPFGLRWPRLVKRWGRSHNAEVTALTFLCKPEHADAIFVTRDALDDPMLHARFPLLDDFGFTGRLFAPHIENGRLRILGIDIPEVVIPTPIFRS